MAQEPQNKCANFEFCQGEKVEGIGSEYCMTCGSWFKICGFGWDKLIIIDSTDDCAVCMNNCDRKLIFPTNCGHAFCIPCSRNILFWDERRYHLSREPFGCPPCPNACVNPIKGKQCYCLEYDAIQDEWEINKPEEYKRWNDAENQSIEDSVNDVTYGQKTCPLCRKKYERKFKSLS
jgi:hypothetical protein